MLPAHAAWAKLKPQPQSSVYSEPYNAAAAWCLHDLFGDFRTSALRAVPLRRLTTMAFTCVSFCEPHLFLRSALPGYLPRYEVWLGDALPQPTVWGQISAFTSHNVFFSVQYGDVPACRLCGAVALD